MTPVDPLADLPRLSAEAAGPCVICRRQMLATGLPIFYRVTVQHCGLDAKAVQQHVGLGMMLGGGASGMALADVMGAHKPPVVVMSSGTVNLCHACAQDQPAAFGFLHQANEEGSTNG